MWQNCFLTGCCSDYESIYEIYSQFRELLKKFRGTSSGFRGPSEFLIFRFLYHQLGGSFTIHKVARELKRFISELHDNLWIGQNIGVEAGGRRIYPDISMYHSKDLLSVIQIKIYPTGGTEEVGREMEKLEQLRTQYTKLRALLMIYEGLSPTGKIFRELREQKNTKEWFDFLILKENEELLAKKLHTSPSTWKQSELYHRIAEPKKVQSCHTLGIIGFSSTLPSVTKDAKLARI